MNAGLADAPSPVVLSKFPWPRHCKTNTSCGEEFAGREFLIRNMPFSCPIPFLDHRIERSSSWPMRWQWPTTSAVVIVMSPFTPELNERFDPPLLVGQATDTNSECCDRSEAHDPSHMSSQIKQT